MDNFRRRGCTCLIVAHRLSTIRDCGRDYRAGARGDQATRGRMKQMLGQVGTLCELNPCRRQGRGGRLMAGVSFAMPTRMPLNDPAQAWLIVSGSVDLFTVDMTGGVAAQRPARLSRES